MSAGSESVGNISTTGYDVESSFVLNRHAHWVAIRSIGGAYWDLNSMLDHPSEWRLCRRQHHFTTDLWGGFSGSLLPLGRPPSLLFFGTHHSTARV